MGNMLENEKVFLDLVECLELFGGHEVFIFGTGVDAELAKDALQDNVSVIAYVDNYRFGEGNYFLGKEIINLQQCLDRRSEKQPIIIATYRFGIEIAEQLELTGLMPGEDFYIWDEMCLFHHNEDTLKYTQFMKDIWSGHKQNGTNKVLIAFDNRHDLLSASYAYCANYFAEKYEAKIYAYARGVESAKGASPIIKGIYEAFNVEEIVDPVLNEKQQAEAEKLCEEIWSRLYTWEDWKNIEVYGICFGTTIIRDFLRVYIPTFDLRSEKMYSFLQKSIHTIVFWYHYINENDVKVVLLADGVAWDGYIRDIANTKGIPAYALGYQVARTYLDYINRAPAYRYYKDMWNQLSEEEQAYGLKWAAEHIDKRLHGGTEEVAAQYKDKHTFAKGMTKTRVLEENDKIKIIIFPHIFEEDSYHSGDQIFDNSYFSWLCHLGELSERTPNYDWYIKMHPHAERRDYIIMDMLLKKYPCIKRIAPDISPMQLKEEGAKFALTVDGTIGHELPEIGIQVINAGNNRHMSYDFTWNPKTKEEYDDLIYNLDKLDKKVDKDELYQFYSINYLFYDEEYISYSKLFFINPLLGMGRATLEGYDKKLGTWKYREYMAEWTKERHEQIQGEMEEVFKKADDWKPNVLYKKEITI